MVWPFTLFWAIYLPYDRNVPFVLLVCKTGPKLFDRLTHKLSSHFDFSKRDQDQG